MTKRELLEIWGFLEALKIELEAKVKKGDYKYKQTEEIDKKNIADIARLQKRINIETGESYEY